MLEHLIPHGFITQLHSPPQAYPDRALKELYLALSESYQYTQFEIHSGGQGATLKQGEKRVCQILSDRLVLKEEPTSQTFEEHIDQLVPIAQEVKTRLNPQVWVFQQSILRFLIPFDQPVAPMMKDRLFGMSEDSLALLGRPILGLCFRVEIPPTPNEPSQMQLRVEPFFRDQQKMYVELNTRFLQPLQGVEELRVRLMGGYTYLRENALAFLKDALEDKSV